MPCETKSINSQKIARTQDSLCGEVVLLCGQSVLRHGCIQRDAVVKEAILLRLVARGRRAELGPGLVLRLGAARRAEGRHEGRVDEARSGRAGGVGEQARRVCDLPCNARVDSSDISLP